MTTWVIVGCGYTGSALARRLSRDGCDVVVTRREPAAAAQLAAAITAAVAGTGVPVRGVALDLAGAEVDRFVDGAIVVDCAPPGVEPGGEVVRLGRAAAAARRVVYLSSTGVYPAAGGAWVDESWPVGPVTAAGRARVAAEAGLAAVEAPTIVLRIAGIHGPERGLVDRIRSGSYRVIGDGTTHVSRIHVVDLVEAIVRAGIGDVAGAVNIADDDPAPIGEVADAIAARIGVPPPPRVPASEADPEVAGMLTADRRISNRRMKEELGVVLRYPSWRVAL